MWARITRPLANQRFAGSDRDGNAFLRFAPPSPTSPAPQPAHRAVLTLARCSVSSHRPRLRRRGVPALRTPFGRVPQFGMVVPHLRTVPPLAARCSVSAHCASLRVLATSALRAFGRSQARLRLSYVPTIRNSRLATLPLASLLPLSPSLDFRFACSAHCARRSSVPQGARFVRPSRALLGFLTRGGGGISLRL